MKSVSILIACLLVASASFSAVETSSVAVHFDTDRDELSTAAQVLLRSFFDRFDPHDDLRVTVLGHADFRGSDAYNMALAQRRCNSVHDFINGLSFEFTALDVDAFGERRPLAAGMSDKALTLNRRVEVIVERVFFESLEDFLSETGSADRHSFLVSSHEPHTLTCRKGSTVVIPANALLHQDGTPYAGQARVELVEAIDLDSFFAHKLSTVSGEDPLVSGGMLQILAFSEQDEPLQFDESQRMEVTVPTDRIDPDMTLFLSDSGANWDNTERSTNVWSANSDIMIDYSIPDSCNCPGMQAVRNPYKGMRGPRKPAYPIRSDEPQRKVVELEMDEFRWWQWRKQQREFERLTRAQDVQDKAYERRTARYERQLVQFYNDSVSYPDRLGAWYLASEAFDREVDSLYCNFIEVIMHEAIVDHKNANAACYEKRQTCIETLYAQADSLREVLASRDGSPVQQYTMELNDFGWINIDRFMFEGVKPVTIVLEVPKPDTNIYPSTVVVFRNERGLMHMQYNISAEQYRVRIPKSVTAEIVSCYVHNDRLYTASAPFEGKANMTLEYVPSTPEAFSALMSSLCTSDATAER